MRWLRHAWAHVRDPYEFRWIFAIAYLVALAGGVVTLTTPPATIASEIGPILSVSWALLLIVGGTVGIATVYTTWWRLEKIGIALIYGGVFVYGFVIGNLHVWSPPGSSRLTHEAFIIFGALLFAVRWRQIQGLSFAPRSREG